ncbi:MAG: transcriptional regulator, partial [Bacilli bacterium]|nr:transcriptional regulator [Bacilli bacterium]
VFIKKLDCILDAMKHATVGYPYRGAKEHYILDIDNEELSRMVVTEVEKVTPIPKKKQNKK